MDTRELRASPEMYTSSVERSRMCVDAMNEPVKEIASTIEIRPDLRSWKLGLVLKAEDSKLSTANPLGRTKVTKLVKPLERDQQRRGMGMTVCSAQRTATLLALARPART